MAPRVGLEPTTNRLTADRSTAELPGKVMAHEDLRASELHSSIPLQWPTRRAAIGPPRSACPASLCRSRLSSSSLKIEELSPTLDWQRQTA